MYYPGLIQCNILNWLSSLKLNTMPQFLGCFVKCFYFIWSKIIITSSCQKCPGEGASIVVPVWWAVRITKVGTGTATRWRIVDNVNVMASSESRPTMRAAVYGISVRTIPPCLRQTRYLFRKSTKNRGQGAICPEMSRSRSYCGVWLTYSLEPEYEHYASQLNIKHVPFYDLKKTNSRKKNCGVLFAKEVCV